MKIVAALALCGAMLAGQARAEPLADLQAATDAFKQGDLTTAEVLLSEAIDSGKLDGEKQLLAKALAWRCAVRIAAEQHDAAHGDCERTIEIDPTFSYAHLNLGKIHVSKLEFEAAIAEFSLALGHGKLRQDEIAMAYSNRGYAHFLRQDYQSALKDFNSALAEDPGYEAALNGRASSYLQIGELDRAMADVKSALRVNPASPEPINIRGLVRMYKGQLDDATGDFDRFIELAPTKPSGYFNRALVMFLKSDWNAAIADLDRLLLVQDDVPYALYLQGLARRKLGQGDLAQQDVDRALSINPGAGSDVEDVLSKLQSP